MPSAFNSDGNGRGSILEEVAEARKQEEREAILRALEDARWNRIRAAEMLKVDYRKLLYKMRRLGIAPNRAVPDKAERRAAVAGHCPGGSSVTKGSSLNASS